MNVNPTATQPERETQPPVTEKTRRPVTTVFATPARRERPSRGTPSSEVAFEVDNLCCWFGQHQAVYDLNLRLPAKAVTAIIGPSGCGKSTFLRSLNRMHELVRGSRLTGRIRLFGEDIYGPRVDPTLVRRRVGMVFQKSNPFPTMTVAENVTVGLRLNGVRGRAVLEKGMERALQMAALWDEVKDHLDRPGTSLSGGQQQRLCIARALAVQPEVILMDEPASALDPIATTKIEELIQELKEDYTIVIVTHNMQQAARCSDYTAFFYMGRLIEYDRTEKVFTNPSNKQTEDYVTGRFG
ncbi:MAG TPA: phosphate ABC transporter ATP-binding protein PstB [Verrucomicrobiae bacterium]|nr:phosphate ABC transporter ATP-binding protein PstB [Verrucomicrobiae bacterium]